MLLKEFDPAEKAVLNPTDICKPIDDFPRICVSTFSGNIVERFSKKPGVEKIAAMHPAFGDNPIYKINHKGIDIAFFASFPGAPGCINGFEDLIALGGRTFVYFGSCGVLDRTLAAGRIILPNSAMRDEGTSYHYAPPSDDIAMEPSVLYAMTACMKKQGIDYITGKTWTTDGFYRETPEKVALRKSQGCITVDMECSALIAAARFRGVRLGEFFYAADNLDNAKWDARDLRQHGAGGAEIYMNLAFECAIALDKS